MLDKRVFIWYNKLQDMKGDVFMAQISFRVDDIYENLSPIPI